MILKLTADITKKATVDRCFDFVMRLYSVHEVYNYHQNAPYRQRKQERNKYSKKDVAYFLKNRRFSLRLIFFDIQINVLFH